MIRTQIQLTEEQAKALKHLSVRKNVSMAELIRTGVDMLLRSITEVTPEERRKRALSIIGSFPAEETDLSVNHDKYLARIYEE